MLVSFAISFVGSLPPGTTNLLTIDLAAKDIVAAIWFAAGCLTGEVIYVAIAIFLLQRMMICQWLVRIMGWVSFLVLLTLALLTFITAIRSSGQTLGDRLACVDVTFIAGMIAMLINPVQIPFWLGWTTVLIDRELMANKRTHHALYVLGVAAGSALASFVFIAAGEIVSDMIARNERTWEFALATIFLIMAILQMRRMVTNKNSARQGSDHANRISV